MSSRTTHSEAAALLIPQGGAVQKSRPTQNKRARERARQEKQQQKAARRLERSQRAKPVSVNGEDPDIAGIVPGPQPSPWGEE
jgi:hypothetical protein